MSAAAITVRELGFRYGGAAADALHGIDLDVAAGEILLVEGPSGGGKSTLLRALCGLVPHFHGGRFTGRVVIDGHDTLRTPPARICRMAGMVLQDPESQAVMGLVARDVAFGLENAALPPERIPARVEEALAGAGALHLRDRTIGTLSGGERQRVAIASVLAARPRVLVLDEPTSQLDADGAAGLMATLRVLADRHGTAIVLSEHRVDRGRPVADRIVAVADGVLGVAGPTGEPRAAPEGPVPGDERVRLEGVMARLGERAVLDGADLALRAGEVVALEGPNGSGKTTLLRILAGLRRPDAGRVLIDGADATAVPAERRFPTIGMVGQDPGRHLLTERVEDEVALALRTLGVAGAERRARVARALDELSIGGLAGRHPLDLSVGQRERVALAAILVADPAVIVLDEPTRGMDPGRRDALARLLRARAAEGAAVLVATHDPGFAGAVADRRVALAAGRVVEPRLVVA